MNYSIPRLLRFSFVVTKKSSSSVSVYSNLDLCTVIYPALSVMYVQNQFVK